ncbi:MAG: hypothetical protein HDS84_00050 [Bacteroidales bacterium]|nr:hypothetical protein [Bacteroidales bacterium]MBD5204766.1 hypothetical protein [Bacteroidales bacterium]
MKLDKLKYNIKKLFPKFEANRLYNRYFGRNINWKNPTEFNEKIRWMQFKTDTSKWTLLADKYKVRKYIEDQGYGELLVKLYGVWDNAEDIDFDKLPESFVIKTNHGCGSVYIVKDKSKVNYEEIRQKLAKDLKEEFGIITAEPHYRKIKRKIIAEELLHQDNSQSSSLIDYKFYCVHGEPQFCGVMFNRDIATHRYNVRLYDNDWNDISGLLGKDVNKGDKGISKPVNFDKMKEFCRNVCKEFPFVRMDFYECDGKLYFGEFTFTPAACTGGSLSKDACDILSKKMKIVK